MSPSTLLNASVWLGLLFPLIKATTTYSPRPYTIDVDPDFIEATREKASIFRPSEEIEAPVYFDGLPASTINELAEYWTTEYDWFSYQDEVNANFSHYYTTVPAPQNYPHDLDVHFIHQRSEREDAIPILLLHGWPSTSLEWERVIPGLVNPENDTQPAFHVVAPDFPGFGFSPAAPAPGLGPSGYGSVANSIMDQLGYDTYVLYSTDLGFIVATSMAVDYEHRILNHVTDFYIVFPNATDIARFSANQTTLEESRYISSVAAFEANSSAYSSIHSTLPLSIAYALNDSPVGFLAWTYQLIATVSDYVYSPSEVINVIMTLYIPGVYGNIRSYKELFTTFATGFERSTVPVSVLQTGWSSDYEIPYPALQYFNYVPKDWIERSANVTYFKRRAEGAHFPAFSRPENWLQDVREIFANGA